MRKKRLEQLVIYQAPGGEIELRGDVRKETIWANQAQIAEVFGVERSVITKHINNILRDKELDKKQVCAKFARTAAELVSTRVCTFIADLCFSHILPKPIPALGLA